ncbi:MAG: hypothetical protein UZ05_CHB002000545 [Chlorobi bacterium OLB5]|nr:MAG: hypothetical protein UZ05_CHB002000545 [Chlorobi bacterium OLB5]
MKPKLLLLAGVIFLAGNIYAQSVNFRFNNYFYGWQRIDSLSNESSAKTLHVRGYQNYLLELKGGQWSFNTLAQTEEDVTERVGRGFAYRFYNLYVKGSNLFGVLDVKLGRQQIFAGTGKGTLDGINFKVKAGKFKEYHFNLYGGALAPYSYELGEYPEIKNNYHFGAMFTYYGVKDLMASLSYSNKKRTPEPYTTYRADSVYNLVERTITFDGPAEQLLGLDLNYTYLMKHNFFAKAYFDIKQKKLYRAEANVRVKINNEMRGFVEYIYREPHYSYNSIFWVFNYNKNQEIGGGLDYTLKNGINIYGKAAIVLYEEPEGSSYKLKNNSVKIQAGFSHPNYGLNFTRYMGYSGESDGVSVYGQKDVYKDKVSASASLNYSNYKLGDYEVDKVNAFSGQLGITYRPMPRFSVDLQGQFLINRIYKSDARFLVGFSYWLFKKF